MKIFETSGRQAVKTAKVITKLERRGESAPDRVMPRVERIVRDVRRGGDRILRRYAAKLDGLGPDQPLLISEEVMHAALATTPEPVRKALKLAAANIRTFAERQLPKNFDFEVATGVYAGQRVRPLDAVGCYVPSGRYPLPSTLLMTAIPAQVAGVKRIVAVSPRPSRDTLAAASLLGIQEFYAIGGAHAIAALAYGTQSISRVNKIVGPGNLYVTGAKKLVAHDCGIDMLAGPTEIGVMSEHGDAALIASDMVAQCEHDADAFAVFITTDLKLAKRVGKETRRQSRHNDTARNALAKNAYIFIAASREEARDLTNRLALEHLTVDSEEDIEWVKSAGSVFVGQWSAQAFGDYITGPNHTLPTGGLAHVRGGLSVLDFVKIMTVQQYTSVGARSLGPAAVTLAECEGLSGHAAAVRMRLSRV
jgi:histidinol dehydrogenase